MTWPTPLHLYGLAFFFWMIVPNFTKPYLTPGDQVALLRSRGMIITNPQKAQSCLERIGYYRLSAYWYPFWRSEPDPASPSRMIVRDDFKPGTRFETIFELYIFDKKLRMIVLDALERIEIALRTDIALLLGKKDIWAHRNATLLHGNFARRAGKGGITTPHQEWLVRLDEKFQKSKEDFVKHFKRKHPGDHLPIWMATELFDFGTLSHFYGGLQMQDQDAIARAHNVPSGAMLETWLRCLNDIRNICAHHSRLWNRPLVNQPAWPKAGQIPGFDIGANTKRLYAPLSIIRFLLQTVHPNTQWGTRLTGHIATLPVNPHIDLTSAGFPASWKGF